MLSVTMQRIQKSVVGFTEPVSIPAQMGWSVLIAVVGLNIFAYEVGFGIGYGVLGICLIIAILFAFPRSKWSTEMWFLAIVGGAACVLFGFRANEFVQIINVVTAVFCMGGLILLRSVETVRWHGLWFLKMKVGFLARFLQHPFSLSAKIRSPKTSQNSLLLTVLKTTGITLVVLFFFSWILSSADPVFDRMISTVFDQAVGRVFLSALLIIVLFAFLTITVPRSWQEQVPQLKVLSFLETFVPAVSLALLFGFFLGVQVKYLFGSHADFETLGMTYADYVRRGFIELLVASFVGSIFSYILILKQHALHDAGSILKLKWVNGVLLIELLCLLASAAKRDWMYLDTYGLTRVRLIGALFLVWLLLVILLILGLNTLRTMTERKLLTGAAVASVLVFLTINAVNIDQEIALSTPPRNARPDIVYISRLSSDAVEGWLMVITEASMRYATLRTQTTFTDPEKIQLADAKVALQLVAEQISALEEPRSWQEWNASRASALKRLHEFPGSTDLIDCVSRGIRILQVRTKTDLYDQESHQVFEYNSPLIFRTNSYTPEPLDMIQPATSVLPSCDTQSL